MERYGVGEGWGVERRGWSFREEGLLEVRCDKSSVTTKIVASSLLQGGKLSITITKRVIFFQFHLTLFYAFGLC